MKKLLQTKFLNFTLDRILGTVFVYFIVFGVVYTVDYGIEKTQQLRDYEKTLEVIAMPASDWIEYISIKPTKEVFDRDEPIELISHTIKKRSALVSWSDILYCDANADGTFAFIYQSDSSKFTSVDEVNEQHNAWLFIEERVKRPRVENSECFVLSQQMVCPPELGGVGGAECKPQEMMSDHFFLTNRDKL